MTEPKHPSRVVHIIHNSSKEQRAAWLRTDSHLPKRDRRTARFLFNLLQAQGYPGGYGRVVEFVRHGREEEIAAPKRKAFVPLQFALGEAFQFDWSCEYAVIGGLRKRLEVAHIKLAASRAFWLVAYLTQSHEMLFDAHAQGIAAFGGNTAPRHLRQHEDRGRSCRRRQRTHRQCALPGNVRSLFI